LISLVSRSNSIRGARIQARDVSETNVHQRFIAMNNSPSIVWFRNDLRLADNAALTAAMERRAPVIPIFIFAPEEEGRWAPGGASRWWLHQSLASLDSDLARVGSRLVLERGASLLTLQKLIQQTGAGAVYWNRRYEPSVIAQDQAIKETLRGAGVLVESFNGALLNEPWTIANKSRKPFQVFTPYWKRCLEQIESVKVNEAPRIIAGPASWPASLPLKSLETGAENQLDWRT
jgi:deoxyribodipyrimidine photo-lyase